MKRMFRRRLTIAAVAACSCLLVALLGISASPAPAATFEPGFTEHTLQANDDGSTESVALPFTIDFFGSSLNSLYVNNNGNVTFAEPLGEYTPEDLTNYGAPIIAPFWADVDTAVEGSALVTYGNGIVAGHKAFGVNWPGVDCFATTGGGLNSFQMVLIERSDIAPGDFDIEFNYSGISWDSGQASGGGETCQGGTSAAVGYTNGSTDSLTLAGSFEDGAFLDSGPHALVSGSQNSATGGRYIFPIRSGSEGGSVVGTITNNASPATPLSGAIVAVCSTGKTATCYRGNSGADGKYSVLGVPSGNYVATVSPPAGSADDGTTSGQFTVTAPNATVENFTLSGPTPPPNGTEVKGRGSTDVGGSEVPVIYWQEQTPITTRACTGGEVTATITAENTSNGKAETLGPVRLTESPTGSGTFTGELPAVYPLHGEGTVAIHVTGCPNPSQNETVTFNVYIDPSGSVVDGNNGDAPVAGATVTLLTSDSLGGSYTAVENGSAVMSPANRTNPDKSGTAGQFGWDTVPGFYEVQATKPGCGTATTPAFEVPPPQTELKLVLHCTSGLTVVSEALPAATRGTAYSYQLAASGGKSPYAWKRVKGTKLPKGLKLGKTGILSGTPSKKLGAGSYPVEVEVTDSSKPKSAAKAKLTLSVS